MTAEADVYLLGRSQAEQERLRKQAQELAGEARWLLDQLQIRPDSRAIELGCGPQGVLDLLAERVGPRGSVVGLEKSADFVAAARQFVADRRLTNVEVVQGDAKATQLPRESFDVVFARLVLVNVPDPERVVEEMVALLRPGSFVASHEADYLPHLCDPPSPAWDRLSEILHAYSLAKGVDLFVGGEHAPARLGSHPDQTGGEQPGNQHRGGFGSSACRSNPPANPYRVAPPGHSPA